MTSTELSPDTTLPESVNGSSRAWGNDQHTGLTYNPSPSGKKLKCPPPHCHSSLFFLYKKEEKPLPYSQEIRIKRQISKIVQLGFPFLIQVIR